MKAIQVLIPKLNMQHRIHIFRSTHAEDINTIAKVRQLQPIAVLNEIEASPAIVIRDGREYYHFVDHPDAHNLGVEYEGPPPNIVPTDEYETKVNVIKINNYTYVNELELNPLPVEYYGKMFYYSCIGVNDVDNTITHLSKVNGVLIEVDYKSTGSREIQACDDYNALVTDEWYHVGFATWAEPIKIGDINDTEAYSRYGSPMVGTVPIFKPEECTAITRMVARDGFMVLEIPNPWQGNNKTYNFRRMKSFRVRNFYGGTYGTYSEPSYQSLLPVSIEKMLICRKDDTDEITGIEDLGLLSEDIKRYTIIRRDGIFYKPTVHKMFGLNKYNIPAEEDLGVFNEASVQDVIRKQIPCKPSHKYSFTVYLQDVYQKWSNPCHFVVET